MLDAILFFLFLPISFVLVVLIRFISPYYHVRFGYISADRIGHFAFDVEYYLSERNERISESSLDLFYYRGGVCNEQLSNMFKRKCRVHWAIFYLDLTNRMVPNYERHTIQPAREVNGSRDKTGIFARTNVVLSFTSEEESIGKGYLQSLGMSHQDRYICLVVRDAKYLEATYPDKRGGWNYHSYRDSELSQYKEAAMMLAEEGYWVIRMGKEVEQVCNFPHKKIIDYATSAERCDELDIWLMANCYFCISTSTGLDAVADAFRRPLVLVNFLPLSHFQTWSSTILVPKTLKWNKSGNEKLTLSEHLENNYQRTQEYVDADILIEDLTSKEILDAVTEMNLRLCQKWKDTASSDQRQNQFWNTYFNWEYYQELHQWHHPEARIGSRYLEDTRELMA